MPITPVMEFHFDDTWDAGVPRVIMTANRVWGPLIGSILFALRMVMYV
jgi:hypothetical protein